MYLTFLGFQAENSARILTPVPGEVLQGLIAVEGDVLGDELLNYELAFALQEDTTQTWFVLGRGDSPVTADLLAEWDTTSLTDGEYILRLTANYQDGEQLEHIVEELRVRNYSPIETSTPSPAATPEPGRAPSATPTLPPPSVTPYAANPASSQVEEVTRALWCGALAAPVALCLLWLYAIRKGGKR